MKALVWLAIPLVATLLAIVAVALWNRPRPPAETHETVEEYERFKAAFDASGRRRKGRR